MSGSSLEWGTSPPMCAGNRRDPGSEVGPEDGTEPLQSRDKTRKEAERPLLGEQRTCVLEMETAPAGDAVRPADVTAKDQTLTKTASITQQQGLRGPTPISEEVLLWVKCCRTASPAAEKPLVKGRAHQCGKLPSCLILRNCCGHPSLQPPPP